MRKIIAVLLLGGWVTASHAQSTVDLDDFDLAPSSSSTAVQAKPSQPASEMESCLLDQAQCANAEYKSNTDFSMDDVVNLMIVTRHDDTKAENGTTGQVTPSNAVAAPKLSTQALPTIDIEILFDSGSDRFRDDQVNKLRDLAIVLSSDQFSGYRFLFLGHTDAKGDESFNVSLSQRRAESVAQLVRLFTGLSDSRVLAAGLGESRLKEPYDPLGGVNRRVQLVLIPQ